LEVGETLEEWSEWRWEKVMLLVERRQRQMETCFIEYNMTSYADTARKRVETNIASMWFVVA
jgi:hypothetical protein